MSEMTTQYHVTDRNRLVQLKELGFIPRRFFDVGSSNGCWSKRVSEAFPQAAFELFEPLADHAPAYRERMAQLLPERPLFRLHKIALGAECRKTKMYLPPNVDGSTALNLGPHPPADWACLEVDMLTVDYVVQEFRVTAPDVMKLDTQGCELNVLRGARQTLPQVQVLVIECWLARNYGPGTPLFLEVAQWLREFDFHLWDVGEVWRDADGTLCSQDCFFLNARCPVSRLGSEPRRLSQSAPAAPRTESGPWFKRVRSLLNRHGQTSS
jgi:FkbM family methyltransferase